MHKLADLHAKGRKPVPLFNPDEKVNDRNRAIWKEF